MVDPMRPPAPEAVADEPDQPGGSDGRQVEGIDELTFDVILRLTGGRYDLGPPVNDPSRRNGDVGAASAT
jgi:hypothetical protein